MRYHTRDSSFILASQLCLNRELAPVEPGRSVHMGFY